MQANERGPQYDTANEYAIFSPYIFIAETHDIAQIAIRIPLRTEYYWESNNDHLICI